MIANPVGLAEAAIEEAWAAGFGTATDAGGASVHGRQWIYHNMLLDTTGRLLPCCAAPKPGFELVFDWFTGAGGDSFNSPKYQASRQWFSERSLYYAGLDGDPYCVRCEWNQDTAHTDGAQADPYFKTVPQGLFGEAARLLAWD